MKRSNPGWLGPSYIYSYRYGITKHRVKKPVLLYLTAVSVTMAAALFLTNLQTQNYDYQSRANLAQSQPAGLQPPEPQPQINSSLVDSVLTNEDAQLRGIIDDFVKAHPDYKWSVKLQGLDGDERSASYDSTMSFRSASIYKLLLMYPLVQKVPMAKWSKVDLDVSGHKRSLSDCVSAMLRVSNNPCGVAVGNYVGWASADDQLVSIGLKATDLNNDAGPTTTASDLNYYLQGIYKGKWFDGATRGFILKALDEQILRGGIPTGCGEACVVADKTGDLGTIRNDVGIINYGDNAYTLSIFSSGAPYSQIAQLAAQIQSYMQAN